MWSERDYVYVYMARNNVNSLSIKRLVASNDYTILVRVAYIDSQQLVIY